MEDTWVCGTVRRKRYDSGKILKEVVTIVNCVLISQRLQVDLFPVFNKDYSSTVKKEGQWYWPNNS